LLFSQLCWVDTSIYMYTEITVLQNYHNNGFLRFFLLIMPDYHTHINLQSSRRAPVFHPKTSKTLFGPVFIFIFYLELYKNKFKNLIRTCKFKFSLRGLCTCYKQFFLSTYRCILFVLFCICFCGFLLCMCMSVWFFFVALLCFFFRILAKNI
jgi:uncharacterized membrane protein